MTLLYYLISPAHLSAIFTNLVTRTKLSIRHNSVFDIQEPRLWRAAKSSEVRIVMKKVSISNKITSFIGLGVLVVSFFIPQVANAADLSAFLVPESDTAEASYVGVRTITLQYPAGSSLAQQFDGKNERIEFTVNGTSNMQLAQNDNNNSTGIGQLINAVNKALLEAQSPAQISEAELAYTGVIKGGPTSLTLSYRVDLKPTLEKFVLQRAQGGQQGDVIDLEWRSIVVRDSVIVNTPEYGNIDINRPIGLLQVMYPDFASKLENTQAREIMQDPLLNFEDFSAPMGAWHFLFDPVGAYGSSVGLEGTGGANVLSIYSLGESSLREGAHVTEEKDARVTIDGSAVNVHSQNPPPSGQIQIAGYANPQERGGTEFATVTAEAPEGVQTSTGGFPIQVLLVLGGMMGAIAVFILFKARK